MKKKNLKKKILGISLSALLVCLPFMSNNVEKVKADDNCIDHTNYYLFNSAYYIDVNNKPTTIPDVYRTSSPFNSELPDGTSITSNSNVTYKWMNMANGEDGWSYSYFWSVVNDWGVQKIDKVSDEKWYYYHDKWWANNDSGSVSDGVVTETDKTAARTFYLTAENSEIAAPDIYTAWNGNSTLMLYIKRTYNNDWLNFVGNLTTSGWTFNPAVLKATFKVCDGSEEPATSTKHKLTIKYINEATGEELSDPYTKDIAENETYDISCKTINGYTNKNSKVSGKMGNEDKEEICYYNPASTPTTNYTLTVIYVDTNSKKIDSPVYKGDELNNPSKETKAAGSDYEVTCPDNLKSGKTDYALHGGQPSNRKGKLNGDTIVTCTYTTDSGQTSDIPIFIVWGIGGAALAYSIYFFRKYYKEQNKEENKA